MTTARMCCGRVQRAIVAQYRAGSPSITRELIGCSRYILPMYARAGILWPLDSPRGTPHHYRWTEQTAAWVAEIEANTAAAQVARAERRRQQQQPKLSPAEWLAKFNPRRIA